MGPLAGSLFVRLTGVLLAAVVVFNVVMALALFAPIGAERADTFRLPIPTQAAAIVGLLDRADAAERTLLLNAVNSRSLHVAVVSGIESRQPSGILAAPIEHFISEYDAVFSGRDIHLELRKPGFLVRMFNAGRQEWEPSRLYVGLTDGAYVLFEPTRGAVFDTFLARGLFVVGIAGVIVLVGLVIAVRRTARPIARLAAQARTLGETLEAPDIPATGPREVQDLALAFNQMKHRISSLVAQRTRLLAAVAHDLRTYMTRLRLRLEFIADDGQRARASRDIDEMNTLVDDTLLFARADNGPADEDAQVDLEIEIASFMERRHETGDTMHMEGQVPTGLLVAMEAISLQRILGNLCDNAVRYGGSARLSVAVEADTCLIHVDDDGPGVPEADLSRMVIPFERLEASRARDRGGAGLGLAIVGALTAAHGGRLTIANRQPHGLRASVTLRRVAG